MDPADTVLAIPNQQPNRNTPPSTFPFGPAAHHSPDDIIPRVHELDGCFQEVWKAYDESCRASYSASIRSTPICTMRLLKYTAADDIHLTKDFLDHEIPRYAILSHTWGSEEVLYRDLLDGAGKEKLGYDKIQFCGEQAHENGLQYFWVDTCCIDKANSVELQEAINSMFRWYRDAARCYVYLADVSAPTRDAATDKSSWALAFRKSRWFTRGWTLQELIAPVFVEFFSKEGVRLGTKQSLEEDIHRITGLPLDVLRGSPLSRFSISERLAWGGLRETTRREDKAYSLLGIFDIYMPLIYGEGEVNAFRRLRTEVEQTTHSELGKRRFEEADHSSAQDSSNARNEDAETNRPSKRRNEGFPSSEDQHPLMVPLGNDDEVNDSLKDSLVERLFFSKIDERLTNLTAAQGKTCRWFLAKQEYMAWRRSEGRSEDGGFLWIKGNPGTGKSTLMKLLFEEAKLSTKNDPSHITLSFFFLARGTLEEKSTTGLYRSILHQLFAKAGDLKASLDWMTADGARGILENEWHDQALKQTLKHAVTNLGSRLLTIFVDALDECDQSQVAGMVCFFEELCDHAQDTGVSLRVCFSSRHYPTVVIEKGAEITLEHEPGHRDDIQQYIKAKLRLGKTKHAESLRSEILEKSSDIFLWVVLVLDILNAEYLNNSVSINALRGRLKEIPPGLNELFEMILARDGKNLDQLYVCLRWILFATRPLKPQEFYFAIQLGLDRETSTSWDQDDIELDQMKMFVRTSTKGLAEVTRNKASEVQFIHESVRDFLLGRYGREWSGPSGNFEGESHNILRDCCLAQLDGPFQEVADIPSLHPQGTELEERRRDLNLKFPFLAYSISSVLRHANSAQNHGMNQDGFLATFPLQNWTSIHNFFEKHAIRRYKESRDLLYILAENDLADLIQIHPQALSCFEDGGERYGPPIFAALAMKSDEAIKAFIKVRLDGEPPESPFRGLCDKYSRSADKFGVIGRSFSFSQRQSLLSQVLEWESEGLLAFFIASGYGDFRREHRRGVLSCAVVKGYESVVTALLATNGIDVKLMDDRGLTALMWAARMGHENIVKLLLDSGANIESKDMGDKTPLSWAVESGHETIVKLLLDSGANIESTDRHYRTPLSWAVGKGHENITKLLLNTGADIESRDIGGCTSLWRATWTGHETMMRLLVGHGADVNSKNDEGQTPVSWAVQEGRSTILQLLLDNGADIKSEDSDGQGLVLSAAQRGHIAVLRLLIENCKADPDVKDSNGKSTLALAAEGGHKGVVRFLLETTNGDVDARDSGGRTPLALAARGGHVAVMQLLLDNGADMDSKDANGNTPLSYAVRFCPPTLRDYQAQLMLLEVLNKRRLMMARGAIDVEPWPVFVRDGDIIINISDDGLMVIRFLLQKGADIGSVGQVLLAYAADKDLEDVAQVLLSTGRVDANTKDETGYTPLERAVRRKHERIVKLLRS